MTSFLRALTSADSPNALSRKVSNPKHCPDLALQVTYSFRTAASSLLSLLRSPAYARMLLGREPSWLSPALCTALTIAFRVRRLI